MHRALWILAVAAACGAQVRTTAFRGREAWSIDTPRLRVTVLEGGGHVAEIVLKDGSGINPLWIQNRPTIEPESYLAARDAARYGGGSVARLVSGLMGHNVCFPFWGNPSPAEAAAGMTYHGETGITRWKQVDAGAASLTVRAELPESRTRFTRTIRIDGPVAYFTEIAANESAWDRPVGWCEHVTVGPPFLDRDATRIAASLTRGRSAPDPHAHEIAWPRGGENGGTDLRRVLQAGGFVNDFLVDPAREFGYFAAYNPKLRLIFGYVFRRQDFPWLNIWEANDAETKTRGMEFSNTPVHGTMRVLVESGRLFDTPVYEWLEAKRELTKRYLAFSLKTPPQYSGVADVRVEDGQLVIAEEGTGRLLRLALRRDLM